MRRRLVPSQRWGAELQVLGPVDHVAADQDESSKQNDSSLVIMVKVAGLRLLLTGDVEPPGQQAILGTRGTFEPMSSRFRTTVQPNRIRRSSPPRTPASPSRAPGRQRLRSSGAAYGATRPVAGMTLLRTDQNGSIAVRLDRDRLAAVTQR